MEPLREAMSKGDIKSLKKEDIRDICLKVRLLHMQEALSVQTLTYFLSTLGWITIHWNSFMSNMLISHRSAESRESDFELDDSLLSFTQDFHRAIRNVKPSVAPDELRIYEEWTKQFGTGEMG